MSCYFFLRGCRDIILDRKDEIPFPLSSVYLRKHAYAHGSLDVSGL